MVRFTSQVAALFLEEFLEFLSVAKHVRACSCEPRYLRTSDRENGHEMILCVKTGEGMYMC